MKKTSKFVWIFIYFLLVSPAVVLGGISKEIIKSNHREKTKLTPFVNSTPMPAPIKVAEPTSNPLIVSSPKPESIVAQPSPVEPGQVSRSSNLFVENGPRVYMYHYIRSGVDKTKDALGYNLSINPVDFEKQLQTLKNGGFQGVTVSNMVRGDASSKSIALSFDDGYSDFYTNAFPLLKKYGFTATVYVISSKDGGQYLSWDQIKELSSAGIEIGSHTVNHKGLDKLSIEDQRYEIFQSKKDIEEHLGKTISSFCYPSGKYNQNTEQLVKEAGYENAVTTKGGGYNLNEDHYILQRVRVSP